MEVWARLSSNQEDNPPVGDQWSGTVRMQAIRSFPQRSGSNWSLKEASFPGAQIPNLGVGNKEAKAEMVPVNACTSKSSHCSVGNVVWVFPVGASQILLNGSVSHRALPAVRQLVDDLTRVPSFLARLGECQFSWSTISQASQSMTASQIRCSNRWSQSLTSPLFEDVQGSNLHQCSECKTCFYARVGMFWHKTKVHGYKSPTTVHLEGNTYSRCAISDATLVRNRGALTRAMLEKDEEKGSARRFLESLDSRIKRSRGETQPGSSRQKRKHSWQPWCRQQAITKAKIRKRASPHPSYISSWFAEHAFSNQSGKAYQQQHPREAGQASP